MACQLVENSGQTLTFDIVVLKNDNRQKEARMPDADVPMGKRYSLIYLRNDEVLKDDNRMRFRMGKLFAKLAPSGSDSGVGFGETVEVELGISAVSDGYGGTFVQFDRLTAKAEIRDLLDMTTLLFEFLVANGRDAHAAEMLTTVRRIFAETQVGYTLDDQGVMHPAFDTAFEGVRQSAIRGLGGEKYNLTRQFVEDAEKALIADPIDGRQAIRNIFEAVENLYKQMYPRAALLNNGSIANDLKPEIEASLEGRNVAKRSALKQVDSFKCRINSAHDYRHAPGDPEPAQPPEELAILAVSQGFGFLRWLVTVQQQRE